MALPPKRMAIYKCSRNFLKSGGGSDIQNSSVVPAALQRESRGATHFQSLLWHKHMLKKKYR